MAYISNTIAPNKSVGDCQINTRISARGLDMVPYTALIQRHGWGLLLLRLTCACEVLRKCPPGVQHMLL
ncbi:MAG: hypothetical protein ACKPKO_24360, partial [Candidatus Fonsibacter sp.]